MKVSIKKLHNPNEKIIRAIIGEKTIMQQYLVDKTEVYKMKVSRLIQKFEQAGVIDKKSYGNTNLITSKII